jgi:hypothetical protein
VENAGIESLHSLHKLRALSLAYTNITDPGVAALSMLVGLTYLSVDSRLIGDAGLQHLPALSNLVALDIFGCKVCMLCLHAAGVAAHAHGVLSLPRFTQPACAATVYSAPECAATVYSE